MIRHKRLILILLALTIVPFGVFGQVSDTTSPTIPTGLSATQPAQNFTTANLEWNASTDEVGVIGYNVFVDGTLNGTTPQHGTASEPFQVNGLTRGIADTQYALSVSAYDAAGNTSAQSQPFILTVPGTGDITPPPTPTNLAAGSVGTESIALSWSPSTDNVGVAFYRIYKNESVSPVATTTGQVTQMTVNGLAPSTAYTFRVGAVDGAGNQSALSGALVATTSPPVDTTAPSSPTGLVAVVSSTSSMITLSWNPSTDAQGVAGYEIFRDGVWSATTTSAPRYVDSGLEPLTGYSYTVSAFDTAGNSSAKSAVLYATTSAALDVTPPSTPRDIVATAVSSSQIMLSWASSTDNVGVVGYRIWKNGTEVGTTSVPRFSLSGLAPATAYTVNIAAYDAQDNASTQSGSVSATTLSVPDTGAPTVPAGLSAVSNSAKQITITWNPSTDNVEVTGYTLFVNGDVLARVVSGTSYSHTGLTPSTRYSYSVSAYDAAGNSSSRSGSVSATTNAFVEEEPFVQNQEENNLRSKINALGNTPDPQLHIPVLLGVEVTQIVNSWGDPRGGGRVHEGTDILAPRGTYVVSPGPAVVIQIGNGANGGNYVYTINPGGEHFYYAHLDGYANGLAVGQVLQRGDLIGYVGDTGNAKGGPTHLHFGIYNPKQNPYPRLTLAFTNDERILILSRILGVAKDPIAEAKILVATEAPLFRDALARGVVLPEVIVNALSAQTLSAQSCTFGRDLTIGMLGNNVKEVQSILIMGNYGPAARALALAGATGYFGPLSAAALSEYHRVLNTCKTAIPPVLVSGTSQTTSASFTRDLSIGSRGADVTHLQQVLIKENKGALARALAVATATGYFGAITRAALVEYQQASGIVPPAGYFGPRTRTYLSIHGL